MENLYLQLKKMGKVSYAYFKKDTVIFIDLDKKFVKTTNKDLKKKFKQEKVSIFKRNEATNMFWEENGLQYQDLNFDDINNEVVKSEVNYKDIIKFKLTPYRKNVKMGGGDAESHDYLGELAIKTESLKFWYNHKYMKSNSKYIKALKVKEELNI